MNDDGELVNLAPDRSHPVSKGFACHKGLKFIDVHNDPDRLNTPLKRINRDKSAPGQFEPLSWDDSFTEVSKRLKDIISRHGATALAAYNGNPGAFNSTLSGATRSFYRQLGVRKFFDSGSQDCSNKFAAGEAVFGTNSLHPIPDLLNTDYCIVIGGNPKISHMSFINVADPMEKLRGIKKRGGTVRFVNPRKIESSNDKTGDVLQVLPDTDVYLLAAMLNTINKAGLMEDSVLSEHAKHVDELLAFVADYSAENVAEVCGVDSEDITSMALEFAQAEKASIYMSTGCNQGRQGTLTYWLLQMMSLATGNLDKEGGNIYSLGYYPTPKSGRKKFDESVYFDSEFGEIRRVMGALPSALFADMIESEEEPIRALIVIAGNPLLSCPGGERLRKAFEKLELIVVLDIYRNATGELADYLLPTTDMFERSDGTTTLGMQLIPNVQYTDRLVAPLAERKEEWWILARLEQTMGFDSVLDHGGEELVHQRFDKMISRSDLSIAKLKTYPSNTAILPPATAGGFFSDWIQTEDKLVDCCPPIFCDALLRCAKIFSALKNEDKSVLKLISRRANTMHNSWLQNLPAFKRGDNLANPIFMSPVDAGDRGLANGDVVSVSNKYGSIEAKVSIDVTLRNRVVAMTHGWGNERSPGVQVAHKHPGVNVNVLLPTGRDSCEKLSNMTFMTGIPVFIKRLGRVS